MHGGILLHNIDSIFLSGTLPAASKGRRRKKRKLMESTRESDVGEMMGEGFLMVVVVVCCLAPCCGWEVSAWWSVGVREALCCVLLPCGKRMIYALLLFLACYLVSCCGVLCYVMGCYSVLRE